MERFITVFTSLAFWHGIYEKVLDILQNIKEKISGYSNATSYKPTLQNFKILTVAVYVVTQCVLG
jgi:hypothetical protein